MAQIFSNENVNKGRQIELDIARGLAVLFMVLIHTQEYFSSEYARNTYTGMVIDFLGGIPAAPVFMFLLGIGIVYTRNDDPKSFVKRGLLLIGAGYTLSFMRGTLPNLFNFAIFKDPTYWKMAVDTFTYVDIFQFSGLAMILFGFIKKFKPSNVLIILLTIGFAVLNLLSAGIQTDGLLSSALSGLFWGSNSLSFFPFLTWIFYPLVGYVFGTYLVRCKDKNRFYGLSFMGALLVLFTTNYVFVEFLEFETLLDNAELYYHHQILGNVIATAIVVIWLSVLYFTVSALPSWLNKVIGRWSKNVSEIYFIHWIIIGWMGVLISYDSLYLPHYFVLMLMIFIFSDLAAELYLMKKKLKKSEK